MTRLERNQKKQKEIQHLENKEKTKHISHVILKVLLIVFLLCSVVVLYARFIGTSGLIVKEYGVASDRLPDSFHGLKIIHLTDLHYGSTIFQKEVNELVQEINQRKPDLVVFTGDLVDKHYKIKEQEQEQLIKTLSKIETTIGKYAVTGNHDYEGQTFNDIMLQSNFTVLDNSSELLYYGGYDPILLVGLSSSVKGKRDIEKAFSYFRQEGANQEIYTITLLHEPDSIDNILSRYPTDLALAGHSHNGQIRIPYYGSIIKVKGARKYSESSYEIQDTKLYVSGGLGTSNYPFRLFDRPSINFFRVQKK